MRAGRINRQLVFLFFTVAMLVLAIIACLISREINIRREAQDEIDFHETIRRLNEIPASAPVSEPINNSQTKTFKLTPYGIVYGAFNPVANIEITSEEEFYVTSRSKDSLGIQSKNFKMIFAIPYDRGGTPNTLEYERVGTFYGKPLFKLNTDFRNYAAENDGYAINLYGTNTDLGCNLPIGSISRDCKANSFTIPYENKDGEIYFEISCGAKDSTLTSKCSTMIENLKVKITAEPVTIN